jgi:hypothetical protein
LIISISKHICANLSDIAIAPICELDREKKGAARNTTTLFTDAPSPQLFKKNETLGNQTWCIKNKKLYGRAHSAIFLS